MFKPIRELISPELKGNKTWVYAVFDEPTQCAKCGKKKKRGMKNKESGEFWCAKCYVTYIGNELKVTLNKRKLALYIIGVVLLFFAQSATIFYLLYPTVTPKINTHKELLIETFYPLSDTRMNKEIFVQVVDAIYDYSDTPDLAFAIIYNESRFNPAAVSSTGARGLHQITSCPGWVPQLIENKIIEAKRDLHGIKIGIEAGNFVLGKHLEEVGGDLPKALIKYHGHKNHALNVAYMRSVLRTYGYIKYSQEFRVKSLSWQEEEAKDNARKDKKEERRKR